MAAEIKSLIKEHGKTVIGQYTIEQVYQGMHGMIGMVTETSKLDPEEGIRFRGYSIPELRAALPKAPGGTEPLPEGIFYLMLIGELPTPEDVAEVSNAWARRSNVPKHVLDMIDAMPLTTHPMTIFSAAVLALQTESVFASAYRQGISKKDYWDPMYEDVMNLIARLPRVAAYIYRRLYKNNVHIEPDPKLDWAANFAHMLGYDEFDVKRLMRLGLPSVSPSASARRSSSIADGPDDHRSCRRGLYRRRSRSTGRCQIAGRSEERRVGKECRSRWSPYH